MILVQIKLFWLKLCHLEAGIVKPLGFLPLLLNSYFLALYSWKFGFFLGSDTMSVGIVAK
jgi:hypothetical protein